MTLHIFDQYELLSEAAASEILQVVKQKPRAVLCLAAGDTPVKAYQLLVKQVNDLKLDFSGVHFIGLDEWVGIGSENPGSCQYFLRKHLFGPLGTAESHIHLFNAFATDLVGECAAMDQLILALGGIDLMLVGIGMNGHVGFNEPGASETSGSHVVDLDEVTQQVGQKYFDQQMVLRQGITLGLRTMQESRLALLMAVGKKKASIMQKTLEESISEKVPASFIRKHANSLVMLDAEAASGLKG